MLDKCAVAADHAVEQQDRLTVARITAQEHAALSGWLKRTKAVR
jgi:hypothetical protein